MLSRNIQADILALLADGKIRTYQEIADKIEVHRMTVYKHIKALSYSHNIETLKGGVGRFGGVRLLDNKKLNIDYLKNDELQLIIEQLELLQNSNVNIKRFVNSLRQIS